MADSEIRIYVACLASYNNGRHHGAWVDADRDADEIRADVAKILRTSRYPNVLIDCPECPEEPDKPRPECELCKGGGKIDSAEEWAIHDYEGFGDIKLSEHESFDRVATLAKLIEDHGAEIVSVAVDHTCDTEDLEEWIGDHYEGSYKSKEDWAEQFLDDTGGLSKVPEDLRRYFDYEKWVRDVEINGDRVFADGGEGVLVFSR